MTLSNTFISPIELPILLHIKRKSRTRAFITLVVCAIIFGLGGYFLGKQLAEHAALSKELKVISEEHYLKSNENYVYDQEEYLKQLPKVKDGFRRFIIYPPKKEKGTSWQADIKVGNYEMEKCNSITLVDAKVTLKKDWNGKGYRHHYYEIEASGKEVTTLMACSPPTKMQFNVKNHANIPKNISFPEGVDSDEYYPIVVDINSGYEIGYKLWKNDEVIQQAEEIK